MPNNTQLNVRQLLFEELNEVAKYDGIWGNYYLQKIPK